MGPTYLTILPFSLPHVFSTVEQLGRWAVAAGEERAGRCDGAHLLHIAQWAARDGDGSTGGVGGDGESHCSSSPLRVMGGTVGHGRSGNGEVGSGRGRKGARWERERCEPGATKRLPRRSRGWATPMRGGEPASSGAAATCHEAERWRPLLAKKGVREKKEKEKKKEESLPCGFHTWS